MKPKSALHYSRFFELGARIESQRDKMNSVGLPFLMIGDVLPVLVDDQHIGLPSAGNV